MSYRLVRPLFFALDAERAHHLSVMLLRLMPASPPPAPDAALAQTVAGIRFPNPVGLAAGYDKEGLVAHKMHGLGFGFTELGTLTPMPQAGNPKPRLFRLVEDRAVINRMGFNNGGLAAAAERVAKRRRPVSEGSAPIVGINIGANKDATDRIADYVTGITCMAPLADYLTVNISSPNTPGLRALQDRAALDQLLGAVMAARRVNGGRTESPAARLPEGRTRSGARGCRGHRRRLPRSRGGRVDRVQHHHFAAPAPIGPCQ